VELRSEQEGDGRGAEASRGASSAATNPYGEAIDEVREEAVRPSLGLVPQPALSGTGFSYRHNWGFRRGEWVLRLNWARVNPNSRVFVAISEGAPGGVNAGKFIGSARYTVHNIAPRAGGVDIWVNIEWGSNISLYADYLVVDTGVRTVRVTVHRHRTVTLTDADADRILADMGTTLQSSDSPNDTATQVRFVRNGPVRTLPATVAATIQTQAQWNALMTAGTGVKVVEAIRWCGGPGGSIIGCAPVGIANINLAVVRFTANQEGILWAHEYGHNASNGHRTDDGRALMFPSIGSDHNVVNATESGRFLSGPVAITQPHAACKEDDAMQPPEDVREFVSRHWIEGVPYQAASQYGQADAEKLVEWLEQPEAHEEFLPQIVTTLGYIGSEVAVQPIIDFVRSPRGGRSVFNAKNAALIHLGDLINKSGSQTALDFLKSVATNMKMASALAEPQLPAATDEAAQAGVAAPAIDALAAELAVSATFGLALAGTPDSEQAVAGARDDAEAFASVNQAAAEAAEIARTVRERGLDEYHRMKADGELFQ